MVGREQNLTELDFAQLWRVYTLSDEASILSELIKLQYLWYVSSVCQTLRGIHVAQDIYYETEL